MSQADAEAVSRWRYPEPYSFYDWTADADDLAELLEPTRRGDAYSAVEDADGELVGFFSCKPTEPDSVEIGLGLRPDLTGRGLGATFVEAGLEHARRRFEPTEFILAVASFNLRAIAVYERAGFARVRAYRHSTNGAEWDFLELRRRA
jgi:[ribosomal protein S18]-alanine N-acetyltransferase